MYLIALNAISMGISTFDFITENPTLNATFEQIDFIFLIIFTVEISVQFIYRGLHLFQDGWLVFDLTIIILSWFSASLQVIRAFRILRASRLIMRCVQVHNFVVVALHYFGIILLNIYSRATRDDFLCTLLHIS